MRLEGVPERYRPDSSYVVSVVLSGPGMRRAGFQLAARWRHGGRAGCSAGELRGTGERTQRIVAPDTVGGDAARTAERAAGAPGDRGGSTCRIGYVEHTRAGTLPVEGGSARWRVRWRAPGRAGADVVFHVAANAANDDASEFGDRIYAAEAASRPPR